MMRALFLSVTLWASAGCPEQKPAAGSPVSESSDVYECPMHCVPPGASTEHTSTQPGSCPVCNMDLVKRK